MKLETLIDIKAEMKTVYEMVRDGSIDSATGLEMTKILKHLQDITDLNDRNEVWRLLNEGAKKHEEYLANKPKPFAAFQARNDGH